MSARAHHLALVRAAELRPGDMVTLKAVAQAPATRVVSVTGTTTELGTTEHFVELVLQPVPTSPTRPGEPERVTTHQTVNADTLVWTALREGS